MDKERLIKLLNLSSSNNDGESLSAIKKANNLIKEHKLNWKNILKEKHEIKQSNKIDYAITIRDLQIERNISQELKDELKFSKMILKYLGILVIILIIIIIFK